MAETDEINEFGREPGFSKSVFWVVFALTVLICYTWRFYWDVSWMLYHRKTQNSQNCSKIVKIVSKLFKIVQISKLGFIFGLWGWASFLSVDWFIAWSDSENEINSTRSTHHITTISSTINWPHHPVCASRVFPEWESWCVIIGLPVPWVCLLCQHVSHARSVPACARGSSLKCLCFPGCFLEVPAVLDVLKAKTLCHCARWLKIHKTVLMAQICL